MLIKIVYGTGRNHYVTNVKAVSFIAHYAEHARPINIDKRVDWNGCIAYSEEFLKEQVGCTPIGEGDSEYYMNEIYVTTDDAEQQDIFYTGTAYLCDDTGKTVDTLR